MISEKTLSAYAPVEDAAQLLTRKELYTPRAVAVLAALAEGKNYSQVSEEFYLTPRSIHSILYRAKDKFGYQRVSYAGTQNEIRTQAAKDWLENSKDLFTPGELRTVEQVAKGLTDKQIAEVLGVSVDSVKKSFAAAKIHVKSGRNKAREVRERRERIKLLVEDGKTIPQICEVLKLSDRMVRFDCDTMGIKAAAARAPKDEWSREDCQRICDVTEKRVLERRLARGMSIQEIAMEDNHDRQYVLQQFHKLGIPIPEEDMWVKYDRDGEKVRWAPRKDSRVVRKNRAITPTHLSRRVH